MLFFLDNKRLISDDSDDSVVEEPMPKKKKAESKPRKPLAKKMKPILLDSNSEDDYVSISKQANKAPKKSAAPKKAAPKKTAAPKKKRKLDSDDQFSDSDNEREVSGCGSMLYQLH